VLLARSVHTVGDFTDGHGRAALAAGSGCLGIEHSSVPWTEMANERVRQDARARILAGARTALAARAWPRRWQTLPPRPGVARGWPTGTSLTPRDLLELIQALGGPG
jgi:hypothetical protein